MVRELRLLSDNNVILKLWTAFSRASNVTTSMNTTKAILTIAIGVGLTLSAVAQPGKNPSEKVDLKSLPASVQDTIKQKSEGGKVTKVVREDDPDGKWNYEVFVTANGKASGFEVDPNGQFVKNHGE